MSPAGAAIGNPRRRKKARWRCTSCPWRGTRGLALRYCPRCERKSVERVVKA